MVFRGLSHIYLLGLFFWAHSALATEVWPDGSTLDWDPPISVGSENGTPSFEGQNIDPLWNSRDAERFRFIHVKVFPHHSKYNAPQGRDTVMSRVRVRSPKKCTLYPADGENSQSNPLRDKPIATASAFSFDAKNFRGPAWLECLDNVQILREEHADRSLRYSGRFFIKKISPQSSPAYLTIVNVLPFEEYLRGVVPSEMPASWSVEALKAQAIAARTYAYYELLSNKAADDENLKFEQSGAQLDDTVTYQAYMGLNLIHANSDAAILATAGRVMTYNGRIIKAYFHADSGGHTEDAVNVWGVDHPYIKGRPEVYPAGSIPGSDWGFVTTLASIQDSLKQKQLLTPNEQLRMVSINERDRYPSGRAQWVSVVTNLGSKKIAGVDFAYALGLKSPWIFLEPMRQSSFRLTGKGFGHGAGMNQWGARVMIEKMNYTHEAVLKFYYTGIDFSQL